MLVGGGKAFKTNIKDIEFPCPTATVPLGPVRNSGAPEDNIL